MAWTAPRTAADGDDFTVDWYNDEIRGNLLWLYNGNQQWVGTPSQSCETHVQPSGSEAVLQPVVVRHPCTITGLAYTVQAHGTGDCEWGLYVDQGDGTAELFKTTGAFAAPIEGATFSAFSETEPARLEPFVLYWFAYVFQNTDARIYGTIGPAASLSRRVNTSRPLPATITVGSTAKTSVAAILAPATPTT